MRKLVLAMVLVVCMGSFASGYVLELKTVDLGMSGGRDGTVGNELMPSDIIGISVWLNRSPVIPSYPFYEGYGIDGLQIAMVASGPGALDVDFAGIVAHPEAHEPRWMSQYQGYYVDSIVIETPQRIAIEGHSGFFGWGSYHDLNQGDLEFLTGFIFHCEDVGPVDVTLELNGPVYIPPSSYPWDGMNIVSDWMSYWSFPGGNGRDPIRGLEPSDFNILTINQIPEPITLGILGLGGLALIRRRLF